MPPPGSAVAITGFHLLYSGGFSSAYVDQELLCKARHFVGKLVKWDCARPLHNCASCPGPLFGHLKRGTLVGGSFPSWAARSGGRGLRPNSGTTATSRRAARAPTGLFRRLGVHFLFFGGCFSGRKGPEHRSDEVPAPYGPLHIVCK